MKMRPGSGFTLIELMIVVAIIGILAAIAINKFGTMVAHSQESTTLGNLASLRSAVSVYYSEQEGVFPSDDLTSLTNGGKYIPAIPVAKTPNYHSDSSSVMPEATPTDTGQWSYDNTGDNLWGSIRVGCTHSDTKGNVWTGY